MKFLSLMNLCDKRVSFCHGCIGPVKNNGLLFLTPYDLVAVTKMRREYFKDGKKPDACTIECIPSFISRESVHPSIPVSCLQRRTMTFRMNSAKLHWDAFKSRSDVYKINLQRLGVPILAV